MSRLSKYRQFVREPLRNKKIDVVCGVGKVNSRRLKKKGYVYASNLVGLFMILNNDSNMLRMHLLQNGISYQAVPSIVESVCEWVRINT